MAIDGDASRSRLLANIIFHELMHNKLDTHPSRSVLSDVHGIANGRLSHIPVNSSMRPSSSDIAAMRRGIPVSIPQYTGGIWTRRVSLYRNQASRVGPEQGQHAHCAPFNDRALQKPAMQRRSFLSMVAFELRVRLNAWHGGRRNDRIEEKDRGDAKWAKKAIPYQVHRMLLRSSGKPHWTKEISWRNPLSIQLHPHHRGQDWMRPQCDSSLVDTSPPEHEAFASRSIRVRNRTGGFDRGCRPERANPQYNWYIKRANQRTAMKTCLPRHQISSNRNRVGPKWAERLI